MRVIIEKNYDEMSKWAANHIVERINAFNPTEKKPFVLGLPTGSTPIGTYHELVRLHKEGKISFKNVVTFNMDEYVGLPEEHPESYHSFMWNNFFSHIDIRKENVNILNGNAEDLEAECARYEAKIQSYGGIHLFMGGIGVDGHLAFNDPPADFDTDEAYLIIELDEKCRRQQLGEGWFKSFDDVPTHAVSMAIKQIMMSKAIIAAVPDARKAEAVAGALEGPLSNLCPSSIMQMHPECWLYLDRDSAKLLKKTY